MSEFEEFGAPHDAAAEQAVVAACFQSAVAAKRASLHVSGRDFYRPVHEFVFGLIADLRREGSPVDPVSIADRARRVANDRQVEDVMRLLPELLTDPVLPENVDYHAEIVAKAAVRRRLIEHGASVRQRAYDPSQDPTGLLESVVREASSLRATRAEDIETLTASEMLAEAEEPYDWVIPGLLERMDRLMLTGFEGLGKSTFLRQLGILAAAGLHPFQPRRSMRPIRVHFIDCENTKRHTRRKISTLVSLARSKGEDPADRLFFDFRPGGIDLLRDKDAAWLHRSIEATRPDLVVIGPIYKVFPRGINTDEEATPAIAALDEIRNHDVALVIEAHSGHTKTGLGKRDPRPRGSSILLGWPEFGYGLRPHGDRDLARDGVVELVSWRGDRDERDWPRELGRGGAYPWTPTTLDGHR